MMTACSTAATGLGARAEEGPLALDADEAEADAFGLNASRQPDGFAQAALALSEYRKMNPGPLEEFLFFDHPSGRNRIYRSMVWKSEHLSDYTSSQIR